MPWVTERLSSIKAYPLTLVEAPSGFGKTTALRHFFEVDRHWVTIAALKALADEGTIKHAKVAEAIAKYGIDVNKPNPVTV